MIACYTKKHRSTDHPQSLNNSLVSLREDFAVYSCTQNLQIAFMVCGFAILEGVYE